MSKRTRKTPSFVYLPSYGKVARLIPPCDAGNWAQLATERDIASSIVERMLKTRTNPSIAIYKVPYRRQDDDPIWLYIDGHLFEIDEIHTQKIFTPPKALIRHGSPIPWRCLSIVFQNGNIPKILHLAAKHDVYTRFHTVVKGEHKGERYRWVFVYGRIHIHFFLTGTRVLIQQAHRPYNKEEKEKAAYYCQDLHDFDPGNTDPVTWLENNIPTWFGNTPTREFIRELMPMLYNMAYVHESEDIHGKHVPYAPRWDKGFTRCFHPPRKLKGRVPVPKPKRSELPPHLIGKDGKRIPRHLRPRASGKKSRKSDPPPPEGSRATKGDYKFMRGIVDVLHTIATECPPGNRGTTQFRYRRIKNRFTMWAVRRRQGKQTKKDYLFLLDPSIGFVMVSTKEDPAMLKVPLGLKITWPYQKLLVIPKITETLRKVFDANGPRKDTVTTLLGNIHISLRTGESDKVGDYDRRHMTHVRFSFFKGTVHLEVYEGKNIRITTAASDDAKRWYEVAIGKSPPPALISDSQDRLKVLYHLLMCADESTMTILNLHEWAKWRKSIGPGVKSI